MDAYTIAYKVARRIIRDGVFKETITRRYASFDAGFGQEIEKGSIGFRELEAMPWEERNPQ